MIYQNLPLKQGREIIRFAFFGWKLLIYLGFMAGRLFFLCVFLFDFVVVVVVDRVVSKRVVLADVPLYRDFLHKVFPYNATLVEGSYDV